MPDKSPSQTAVELLNPAAKDAIISKDGNVKIKTLKKNASRLDKNYF